MGARGILCTRGEKEYASIRQSIVVYGDCLVKSAVYDAQRTLCHYERKIGDPKRYFRTFGEKEYASIRQAIVACGD